MARNKYVLQYSSGVFVKLMKDGYHFDFVEDVKDATKFKLMIDAVKALELTKEKGIYGDTIISNFSILEVYTVEKPLKRSEFRRYGTKFLKDFIKL